MTFYNEFDPGAAKWLTELAARGHISRGIVDERPIQEIKAGNTIGYDRCHFFAGIGGWDYALSLAGWPEGREVWTGSCPCQPYSTSGKRRAQEDERDLWPEFFRLIGERRPQCIFGEQVESAIGFDWLDRVCSDLEAEGYAVGACVLGAHSAAAPHVRQRLYWVADRNGRPRRQPPQTADDTGNHVRMAHADRRGDRTKRAVPARMRRADAARGIARVSDAAPSRLEGEAGAGVQRRQLADACGGSFWAESEPIRCKDGRSRRIPREPALYPLADGIPNRVGIMRGAGNAIVPQVAAEFVRAFLDTESAGI